MLYQYLLINTLFKKLLTIYGLCILVFLPYKEFIMSIFSPAKFIERLPEGEIDPVYKSMHYQVFTGTFIGTQHFI